MPWYCIDCGEDFKSMIDLDEHSCNINKANNHQGVNYHESEVKGDQPLPGANYVQKTSKEDKDD